MDYRVTVTVEVQADGEAQAERAAMKAIVSDLVGWSTGDVTVEVERIG